MEKITLYDLKATNIIDFGNYDFADIYIDITFYMIPGKNDELMKKIKVCNISKNYITCNFYDFMLENKKLIIDHIKQQGYYDKDFEKRYIRGIKECDVEFYCYFMKEDLKDLFEEY